ncbi:hypothetical protein B0H13DRAFT_1916600 [Mycena leptocephala]|nr:hypothetical protein B0H13DRAFT_1916600 [Mycena leptocephala]
MSSIQDLRARIEKISTEIDLQKEVLKKLEHDKSLVQRQLNTALDPVARLPFEISSEIFLQSLPDFLELGARHVPMLLVNICNTWTDIALATPAFGLRAGNRPLSISLRGKIDADVATMIWKHGQQLKHLEICYTEDDDDEDSDESTDIIDLFGAILPGPLPMLETLTLVSLADADQRGYPVSKCYNCCISLPISSNAFLPLVIPNLRRLIFGGKLESPDSDDEILTHLSLPALETLSLWLDISGNDLLSFFLLSSPPLRELIVGRGAVRDQALVQLHECFRLVPTLLRLEIHAGCRFLTELFNSLADSPSLLPNLHKLVIHLDPSDVPDSFWKTALRSLSARHIQLKIGDFKLTADPPESLKPPADVLAAFRELAADGMRVLIGTENLTFWPTVRELRPVNKLCACKYGRRSS